MDITIIFKACVKTVRTRNKAFGDKDKKTDILKRNKDANLTKARETIKQISTLRDFLNENRKAYISVISHFSNATNISDYDRENIDQSASKYIEVCTLLLQELRNDCSKKIQTKQVAEHYANVIISVENYLKIVGKSYAELKALRVKRALDNRKISKLELDATPKKQKIHNLQVDDQSDFNKPTPIIPDKSLPINPEDQLSSEEMQMFESENEQLYNDLNSVSEEVQQIESKVVHITELQEAFTEKVLQQEKDIERIATTVVGATENVRDANDQIRQAIQRNAGLRVWILFFLLVMSLSLLFLDWYND